MLHLLNANNRLLGIPALPAMLAPPPLPAFKPMPMPMPGARPTVGRPTAGGGVGRGRSSLDPTSPVAVIAKNAARFGLDPAAVLAYALEESGGSWHAVGDNNSSFGPLQMHRGGALGAHSPQWAMSPAGLIAGMQMMANTPARGLSGAAAVRAIYQYFGKGTSRAIPKGLARYGQAQQILSGQAAAPTGAKMEGHLVPDTAGQRYREAQLLVSAHAADHVQQGVPQQGWTYPPMVTGGQSPYQNLSFAGHTDFVHVDTSLLQKLNQLARILGVRIDVISGYRAPGYSASHGGYANDPHARGVAVDAYIHGVPIGSYRGAVAVLKQLGLESGAQPGFYHGKSDPEHVQIPGSGVNKGVHAHHTLR